MSQFAKALKHDLDTLRIETAAFASVTGHTIEALENDVARLRADLDWIENQVRHQLGDGDWWRAMHDLHTDWSLSIHEAISKYSEKPGQASLL